MIVFPSYFSTTLNNYFALWLPFYTGFCVTSWLFCSTIAYGMLLFSSSLTLFVMVFFCLEQMISGILHVGVLWLLEVRDVLRVLCSSHLDGF